MSGSGEYRSVPPDRVDHLVDGLSDPSYRTDLRKCSVEPDTAPSRTRRYTLRAKQVFHQAVKVSGGASLVAHECDYDESNIRLQIKHPDRTPSIEAVCGCDPEGIELAIDFLHAVAQEKRRLRRVG